MAEQKKKQVIIALDGSDHSERAFNYYVNNLHKKENEIILLHCAEPSNVSVRMQKGSKPPYELWREIWEEEKKQSEHIKQKYTSLLRSRDLESKFAVQQTLKPGEAIVSEARQRDAALIVLGSRGLGALARVILGSVSSYVLHHAHCPVLIHQAQKP